MQMNYYFLAEYTHTHTHTHYKQTFTRMESLVAPFDPSQSIKQIEHFFFFFFLALRKINTQINKFSSFDISINISTLLTLK